MTRKVYALLGRKDEPTDAVEEYCRCLGAALLSHKIDLQIHRVPWEIHGWSEALRGLKLQAKNWRETWVLVQFTALAWSARGFPLNFIRVLRDLKSTGAKVGIVFHDVAPYTSPRLIDQLRYRVQLRVLRRALQLADRAVFTVPLDKIAWLAPIPDKAAFVPVGPNLPFPETPIQQSIDLPTVGIFSITGGQQGARETQLIITAMLHVAGKIGSVRLSVFGRHAEERGAALRQGLRGVPVQLSVEGVVGAEQVISRLSACHLLLFVRGGISTRRGSAIAGIAAGLPIVAYEIPETSPEITNAGVVLINPQNPTEVGDALVRILTDATFRAELAARSRTAYEAHFAWPAIALRFAAVLQPTSPNDLSS